MENENKHPLDGKLERIAAALEGILYQLTANGGAKRAASGAAQDAKITVRIDKRGADWKNGGGAFYSAEIEGTGERIHIGAKDTMNVLVGDIFEGLFSKKGDGEKAVYFLSKVLKVVASTGAAAGSSTVPSDEVEDDIPF